MSRTPGVVRAFKHWYVPTELYSSERFVSTTKQQNDTDIGSILCIGTIIMRNKPK